MKRAMIFVSTTPVANRSYVIRPLAIMAFALLSLGAADDAELPVITPGDETVPAPDFELADLGGELVKLSEIDGPVTLLYFWSKYRECEADLKLLEKLQEKYADDGVNIIGVVYSSGSRDELTTFLEDLGVTIRTVMCPREVLREYDVSTFPTTFLLDAEHNIRYWMYGILVDWHWDRLIEELLDAETVAK